MLENKRVQKPREFWIITAYFRASTVFILSTSLLHEVSATYSFSFRFEGST